ncbi:uncharacterized protein LOC124919644 [Impatiens glandulifera]|uniref:uncharacterized protein LOC124919644 n=1 Tax=Impatiens glandulifera TaxID=253017 RepID=UPI001FB13F0F|nr:uncharacterized protein LOC124919644 [Impatiens glandulifera]
MKGNASFMEVCTVPLVHSIHSASSKFKTVKKAFSTPIFTQNVRINAEAKTEIRVCVNRTCRRQGSLETFQVISGIAPPDISVKTCGCLGSCGNGPNLLALPGAIFVSHCGTAARAAQAVFTLCNISGNEDINASAWISNSLTSLGLRKRAEDELRRDNASEAQLLLTQAISLKPCGGLHIVYKDRSASFLTLGKLVEALEDANKAVALAPKDTQAYLCQGDAFMGLNQFELAEQSYIVAAELDPPIQRSKSFKMRIAKLQGKVEQANLL